MTRLKDLIDIFLQPGEFFVADADYQLRTMLGSCVSITLWHPASRIGAMSHFLLPKRGADAEAVSTTELDARYGDEAMRLMLAELSRSGIRPATCQGKIFGGSNMFPGHLRAGSVNVGQRNGQAARALLNGYGIPIVSESLFGIGHRQIIFNVSNGDVWSRQVRLSAQEVEASGGLS